MNISCVYRNAYPQDVIGSIYTCEAHFHWDIDDHVVDFVFGTHINNKKHEIVERIILRNEMHRFPLKINNFFKNLQQIEAERVNLEEIRQFELQPFGKLKKLNLASNKIKFLEPELFKHNMNLEFISLESNLITHIDPTAFKHLKNLKFLLLQSNKCSSPISNVMNDAKAVKSLIRKIESEFCVNDIYPVMSEMLLKYEQIEIENKHYRHRRGIEMSEDLKLSLLINIILLIVLIIFIVFTVFYRVFVSRRGRFDEFEDDLVTHEYVNVAIDVNERVQPVRTAPPPPVAAKPLLLPKIIALKPTGRSLVA